MRDNSLYNIICNLYMTELLNCRICNNTKLIEVVNLGNQIITSRFPLLEDSTTPSGMIRLVMCDSCKLVQLKDSTPASEMYEHFYGYRSGINETMRTHLKLFNAELQEKVELNPDDLVLDIGSNDCTFLGNYPDTVRKYGCDPTGIQFNDFYIASNTRLIPTYFTKGAIESALGNNVRFKAVTSISMFYDLPDPVQFAKDIYNVLDDNGIWGFEQSYVSYMLERNSIDTICHEHLEYYGVRQIKEIMDRAGFKIIDIGLNECNGGSFRTYVAKKESMVHKENLEVIEYFLNKEEESLIHTVSRYEQFVKDCKEEVDKLVDFIKIANLDGKKTYIYGASTKGNCLLQFAKLDSSFIKYAVERNPLKVGRMTSTGIEIISEETMRENPPDYMLVLPWHFRSEIIKRENNFLENGGQLLFPFPRFEIYSSKPKTLITGINGQIGTYSEKIFALTDVIYGIASKQTKQSKSLRIHFNLTDLDYLDYLIRLIQPDKIIHLASISNTEECEKNPIETIDTNGRLVASMCYTIYKNKLDCKLFNASSSELYNGHIEYLIKDNDTNMFPNTLYGITKMMGHKIVDHYRLKYNLPFSNGIIFTTESKLRNNTFLLKKVVEHARNYKNNLTPIILGNLESWRNINHAEDVAVAIKLILEQEQGDTYVISNTNFNSIEQLVIEIYKRFNITLSKQKSGYIDLNTNNLIIQTDNNFRNTITKINGVSSKLLSIGWKPIYNTQSILDDLLEIS
jgi:GDP-D-mannose dehydratase